MLSWANFLVYLELPDWFEDFDRCQEREDDDVETKAIKVRPGLIRRVETRGTTYSNALVQRFINGDDKYRGERLKLLPSLAAGPMPIKMLMPSKKEITVECESLPLSWRKYPREELPDGTVMKPCLEIEVDGMSSNIMQKVSSLGKRYLKYLALDLAVIVSKPKDQASDEPSACLGLFRLPNSDPAECSSLPDRDS